MNIDDQVDRALVQAAKDGLECGHHLLYCKYWVAIYGLVMRYEPNPTDAMALVGDIMMDTLATSDQFRGDSTFFTWLYKCCNNRLLDVVAKKARSTLDVVGHGVDRMNAQHYNGED